MSGKLRNSRGKHSFQNKKKKGSLGHPVIVTQPPADTPIAQSVPVPEVSRKPVPATVTAVQHPYILIELRRIGILAGIILAILVVLALILA